MSSKSLNLVFHARSRQKYGNTKHIFNNIEFSSKLEMNRYIFLLGAEEQGEIEHLRMQVPYELIPKQTHTEVIHLKTKDKIVERTLFRPCIYVADFVYERNGDIIVEDTKGFPDQKFPIKQKLMYYVHHLLIHVIKKATAPLC